MLNLKTKQHPLSTQKRQYWTPNEDKLLQKAVKLHNSNWKTIAEYFVGRNGSQCSQRWKRIKPQFEKKKFWTPEEDKFLESLIQKYQFEWKTITSYMDGRSSKQVRERYINHLDPLINKKPWTQEEDQQLWALYQQFGPKWSNISQILQGRPENSIKNRYYWHVRKFYAQEENPYYVVPQMRRSIEKDDEQDQSQNNLPCSSKSKKLKKYHHKNQQIAFQSPNALEISFQRNIIQEQSQSDIKNRDLKNVQDFQEQQMDNQFCQELLKSVTLEQGEEESIMQIENWVYTQGFEFNLLQNQLQIQNCNQQEDIFEVESLR
ncbi:unnamed protein product [Paramecium octaurelia]|uniref:Uncharacterized protein n=1 Tax=Paramecium octaurelia TaxID=43137 RepID=A0A8S1VCS8_PAROT|nr:unnamed protein product [Paramecium octaurelia]